LTTYARRDQGASGHVSAIEHTIVAVTALQDDQGALEVKGNN